ncbi:MAG TPA: hypothetical protein VGU21_03330 [Streptosporangiaceae bacterium]|nr:hypothetical protein [Streptosporangiaceae bacterium]
MTLIECGHRDICGRQPGALRLRATATVEIDASAPLAQVVRQLEDLP